MYRKHYKSAFNRGVACAFWWHLGSGELRGALLLPDARGRAGKHLRLLNYNPTTGTPAKPVRPGLIQSLSKDRAVVVAAPTRAVP